LLVAERAQKCTVPVAFSPNDAAPPELAVFADAAAPPLLSLLLPLEPPQATTSAASAGTAIAIPQRDIDDRARARVSSSSLMIPPPRRTAAPRGPSPAPL